MRKMRKLTAVLALVAFVFCFIAPVSAMAAQHSETAGSITVTNATENETYVAYKIFDVESYSEPDADKVAYTASTVVKNWLGSDATASTLFNFTQITTGKYVVSKTDAATNEAIINFFNGLVTENKDGEIVSSIPATIPQYNAGEFENDCVVFTNLPYGYYLVTSSLGAMVTIDSTTPHVDVIDKNQSVSFKKEIDAVNDAEKSGDERKTTYANIGDVVTFLLTAEATSYVGESTTPIAAYTVTDTLPAGLNRADLSEEDLEITVSVNGEPLENNQYTGNLFGNGIVIPWSGEDAVTHGANATITVEFKARLNENAVIESADENDDNDGNVNNAALTWTGNTTPLTDSATVKTSALALVKVNEDHELLAGATFQLPFYVKATSTPNVYTHCKATTATAMGATNEVSTDAAGKIVILGLAPGNHGNIEETVAPDGYNRLTDVIAATVTSTVVNSITLEDENETSVSFGSYATAIKVVNTAGTVLPSTGGIGTTIFYAVGAALVLGAGVLLVTKRRMSAE